MCGSVVSTQSSVFQSLLMIEAPSSPCTNLCCRQNRLMLLSKCYGSEFSWIPVFHENRFTLFNIANGLKFLNADCCNMQHSLHPYFVIGVAQCIQMQSIIWFDTADAAGFLTRGCFHRLPIQAGFQFLVTAWRLSFFDLRWIKTRGRAPSDMVTPARGGVEIGKE